MMPERCPTTTKLDWKTAKDGRDRRHARHPDLRDHHDGNLERAESTAPTDLPVQLDVPAEPRRTLRRVNPGYDLQLRLAHRLKTRRKSVSGLRTGAWNGSAYATAIGAVATSYDYDANGNVIKMTDANGGAVHSYYDKLGRKMARSTRRIISPSGVWTRKAMRSASGATPPALPAPASVRRPDRQRRPRHRRSPTTATAGASPRRAGASPTASTAAAR